MENGVTANLSPDVRLAIEEAARLAVDHTIKGTALAEREAALMGLIYTAEVMIRDANEALEAIRKGNAQ